MRDIVLFVVLPYVAVLLLLVGSAYHYVKIRADYSKLVFGSEDNDWLFWGTVPWYYGIIPTLLIHLGGFSVPGVMAFLHSTPTQLYVAELAGKVLALLAFVGLVTLIVRRLHHAGLRVMTSAIDWIVLALFFNQLFLGLWTAFFYRWGSAWFIYTVTPWVFSLATFDPKPEYVAALQWVPKLHFLNATLLIALFSFSRMVHLVTFPITYSWRRLQVVIRNRRLMAG